MLVYFYDYQDKEILGREGIICQIWLFSDYLFFLAEKEKTEKI